MANGTQGFNCESCKHFKIYIKDPRREIFCRLHKYELPHFECLCSDHTPMGNHIISDHSKNVLVRLKPGTLYKNYGAWYPIPSNCITLCDGRKKVNLKSFSHSDVKEEDIINTFIYSEINFNEEE